MKFEVFYNGIHYTEYSDDDVGAGGGTIYLDLLIFHLSSFEFENG